MSSNNRTKIVKRGRPRRPGKSLHKVVVAMSNEQVVMLDQLSLDIRRETGIIISRTNIIRTLASVLEDLKLNLSKVTSEDKLRDEIIKNLSVDRGDK